MGFVKSLTFIRANINENKISPFLLEKNIAD